MKTKEQLAEQYANEQNSAYTNDYYGFLAGYNSAIEKVKEYLFNTEEHTEQYKNDFNYISPEYLKQTIKFLNEQ
jgi:hypothetical protein